MPETDSLKHPPLLYSAFNFPLLTPFCFLKALRKNEELFLISFFSKDYLYLVGLSREQAEHARIPHYVKRFQGMIIFIQYS